MGYLVCNDKAVCGALTVIRRGRLELTKVARLFVLGVEGFEGRGRHGAAEQVGH